MDPPNEFPTDQLEPLQSALGKLCFYPKFMLVDEWNSLDESVQEMIQRIYKICNIRVSVSEESDKVLLLKVF